MPTCLDVLLIGHLVLANLNLLLSLSQINVGRGFLAVKDDGNFLKGGALGLDKDKVDPNGFKDIPALQTRSVLANKNQSKMARPRREREKGHTV
jgi:hypothetical protein